MQTGNNETSFTVGDLLRLRSFYRHFGSDEGPSLEVHVKEEDGNWRRVARYDCFRDEPHRHIFTVDGKDDRQHWGAGGMAAALDATAGELETDLPGVVRKAGLPSLVQRVADTDYQPIVARAVVDLRHRAVATA